MGQRINIQQRQNKHRSQNNNYQRITSHNCLSLEKKAKNLFNIPLLIKTKAVSLQRLFLSKSFVYGYCLIPIFLLILQHEKHYTHNPDDSSPNSNHHMHICTE